MPFTQLTHHPPPSQPHCPSCSSVLEDFARSCPRCSFTATVAIEKFPFRAPRLERYLDAEGRLTGKHRCRLNRAIDRFERIFPQARIYICVTRLPDGADCREFGYWLFNVSPPVNEEDAQHRFFSSLIVIDRANRAASITVGYGLDLILSDYALFQLLEKTSGDFKRGKYKHGLLMIISSLETQIKLKKNAALEYAEHRASRRRASTSGAPPSSPGSPTLTHGHP